MKKEIRIKKENLFSKKARIFYLQILILIIASFAFSFIVYSSGKEKSSYNNRELTNLNQEKVKKTNLLANFFASWLKRSKLNLVSAQTLEVSCCPELKSGALCRDVLSNSNECKIGLIPTPCSKTSVCKLGCCYDSSEGLCQSNTPKSVCEENGVWKDDANCNVLECRKGCCILPTQDESWYMTETRCSKLSAFYGVDNEFLSKSEEECIKLQENEKLGACIYNINEQKFCKLLTRQQCLKITNEISSFNENYLCSNPGLNTTCEKTDKTSCLDGKDEVYFLDSCNNRANIYDASKANNQEYWNFVFDKNKSCNPNSGNINSESCGNCNYKKGSYCTSENGNNFCKDFNCKDKGKNYLDGETWCDYESYVGDGKDVPGSRQVKKTCDKGKVLTEACEDFRQEVCAEKTLDGVKTAYCRINRWRECLNANSVEEDEQNPTTKEEKDAEIERKCLQNPDCDFRVMNIFEDPKNKTKKINETAVKVCSPKYPPGLDINENMQEGNKQQCNQASLNCTVVFVCGECVANCNCLTKEFTETMNDWCMSMGDCGAKSNIEGEVTSGGYSLKQIGKEKNNTKKERKPPKLSQGYLDSLKEYANPVPGQKISDFLNGSKKEFVFDFYNATNIKALVQATQSASSRWYLWLTDLIFGAGRECSVAKKKISFTCNPWQQPTGGANCEKCSDKIAEGFPCSEYRCKSLGAACEIINKGTGQELCVWTNKTDNIPPIIDLQDLSPELRFEGKNENQAKIMKNDGTCLESFSQATVNVKTNEPALCKYDFYDNLFDDLDNYLGEFYVLNHNLSLNFPNKDALLWELNSSGTLIDLNLSDIKTLNDYLDNMTKNLQLHIKCRDKNANEKMYQIRTCVSASDSKEPEILSSIPPQDGYFAYNKSSVELNLWINEPAECRWSERDKEYGEMANNMTCLTGLVDITPRGWNCHTTLPKTTNRTYYVRCLDQPWKQTNRNANSESYVLNLKESSAKLKIISLQPNRTIISGIEPATIILTAKTEGGAENGKSFCDYSFDNLNFYLFLNTNSNQHTQEFSSITRGSYNVYVKCEDIAGNKAEGKTSFKLEIDNIAPKIIRAYNENGLKIITDEDSKCAYTNNNCNFAWQNATEMTGILREHTTSWELGTSYYVKCKDLWDNKPDSCSIIVKAV